ncbi:hydrogenase maturation protease [Actinocorallia sp. A-T 12471]|uniref:hydrogenase maturation protease n=1 Tax=Actinocorallia sp. A-T 12471 TaxID=3089813 RepID=UPI0029D32D4A|nr:hydrogenase maturation protease [Actinocorallia sp. A-T 12471]MDX6739948.1 hydrogenase maturation protease [Actinocorallia sp. A-T 12471]
MSARVLVAGIGNVFLGDDGFGVEVLRRLDPALLPDGVRAADYGIRGVHLAYELLDGTVDTLVMVDAVPLDGRPGALAVLEVGPDDLGDDDGTTVDAHGLHPLAVLHLLRRLGGSVDRVFVVGCRPESLEEGMRLTPAVEAAVDEAVGLVVDLVRDLVGVPGASTEREETADA